MRAAEIAARIDAFDAWLKAHLVGLGLLSENENLEPLARQAFVVIYLFTLDQQGYNHGQSQDEARQIAGDIVATSIVEAELLDYDRHKRELAQRGESSYGSHAAFEDVGRVLDERIASLTKIMAVLKERS